MAMDSLLAELRIRFPELNFRDGQQFCWSPQTQEVIYASSVDATHATWSLLHETGHALLNHRGYQADFELIRMEVAAWERARSLGQELNYTISENHIQDCLDTYRDWLYKRSICPSCSTKCLQQQDLIRYRCFNCHTVWSVTPSRFCRTYRSTKKISPMQPVAVFNVASDQSSLLVS
jgi:hypothetical protein